MGINELLKTTCLPIPVFGVHAHCRNRLIVLIRGCSKVLHVSGVRVYPDPDSKLANNITFLPIYGGESIQDGVTFGGHR